MSARSDYVTGWINTSMHDFLREIDEPTASMKYALVTYLDSNPEVASLFEESKQLSDLKGKFQAVGAGALIATRQLLAAERRQRIFFGFDEVWFFPESDVAAKPEGFVITAPDPIDPEQIDRYSSWLTSNRCALGLGDGVGMNYGLRIRGAARYIVQAINESHPHSLDGRREIA